MISLSIASRLKLTGSALKNQMEVHGNGSRSVMESMWSAAMFSKLQYPKRLLGVNDNLSFEFKWNDNMQHPGDIMDFYVNGDTAPGGRFNYIYGVIAGIHRAYSLCR